MNDLVSTVLWILVVTGVINILSMALLWSQVFKPLSAGVIRLVPLIDQLAKAFPDVIRALREMEAHARSSGLSLSDAVSMLEDAVIASRSAARRDEQAGEVLRLDLHDDRLLAKQDRDQLEKLLILLDRLGVQVEASGATGLRMERQAEGIANNLAVAQQAVQGVADDLAVSQRVVAAVAEDLAASHQRADETAGPHGAAADAASSSGEFRESEEE